MSKYNKIDKNNNCSGSKKINKNIKISDAKTEDFEIKIEEIRQALKKNFIQQKKLTNDLKNLLILHKKEIKLLSKSNNNKNSGRHSGFNKPEPVPSSLRKLLSIDENILPRSTVTRLMYKYFTDNNMCSSKTKREIIPNNTIKKIFGMKKDDIITFYNLQTWLKKVYDENDINDTKLEIDE